MHTRDLNFQTYIKTVSFLHHHHHPSKKRLEYSHSCKHTMGGKVQNHSFSPTGLAQSSIEFPDISLVLTWTNSFPVTGRFAAVTARARFFETT